MEIMSKDDWWEVFDEHAEEIKGIVTRYARTGGPAALTQAVAQRNGKEAHRIMSQAWNGAPDSRSVYSIPGFSRMCDLLEESHVFWEEDEREGEQEEAPKLPPFDKTKTAAYLAWINEHVQGDGYGNCHQVAQEMAKAFPELEYRKGFFFSLFWGRRQHGWCRDDQGRVVDPTARQFPDGVLFPDSDVGKHEDLTDVPREELVKRVPSGRCAECSGDVFGGDAFCSESCEVTFMRVELGMEVPPGE